MSGPNGRGRTPDASIDSYTVEILDDSKAADRARLAHLIDVDGYAPIDELSSIAAELDGVDAAANPRWIAYPWRRMVVRLPGPTEFRRLRSDRNRNKLTAAEQEVLAAKKIGVVGLSVGNVIAHTLAMEGIGGELRLVDGDTLELTNLNRIPGSVLEIGHNKALLAARRIVELDPYINLTVEFDNLDAGSSDRFVDGLDLVVEECDSLDAKLDVRAAAQRHRVPVVMHTSDGGLLDVERFDLDPDRPILHGLIGGLTSADVAGLTTDEKVPFLLGVLDAEQMSARLGASMLEIDHLISTWPQLAEDVVLGGASVAATARRILLGLPVPSGRSRVDLDADPEPVIEVAPPVDKPPEPLTQQADDVDVIGSSLVDRLLWAAGRAPSGGNVQPWRFSVADNRFGVMIDPAKTTGMDIGYRGSQLAVGAALLSAEIVASSAGALGPVSIEGSGSDTSAWLELGDGHDPSYESLAEQLAPRVTNRAPATPAPLPTELREVCERWSNRFGTDARLIDDRSALDQLAKILGAADRLRFLNEALHREMMSELRWPGDDPSTGISMESLFLAQRDAAAMKLIRRPDVIAELRSWNGGEALTDIAANLLDQTSGVLVLAADRPDAEAMVNAGRSLQAIWLESTRLGLGLHPVSPLFLYAADRSDCLDLVDLDRAADVWELREAFCSVAGIDPERQPALIVRLTHPQHGVQPTERVPPAELVDPE